LSQQAVVQQMGVGYSTVSNWLAAGIFPERKLREQASHLDRYIPYLILRSEDWCHSMACLFRELAEQGYKGLYESIQDNLVRLLSAVRKNAVGPSLKALCSSNLTTSGFLVSSSPRNITGSPYFSGECYAKM
jgi:hypothetical protein